MVVVGVVELAIMGVGIACFAWFSEKHCLLIARSEGSLSEAFISDLLPAPVVVGVVVAVDVATVGVGVCALSLSSASSSFVSCWYISSTMGFHNRTLALMNQFETGEENVQKARLLKC